MVLNSSKPDLVIPKVDFYTYNVNKLKASPDDVAMVDALSGRELTYQNIHDASIKLASALTRRGLKKQDVVALCSSNCIEYSLIILGAAACNAITTTCNPRYTKDETLNQLLKCEPKFVITDSDQVSKMLEVQKEVTSIQEIISVDSSDLCVDLWKLINKDDGAGFPSKVDFDLDEDVVLLPFSSGTTGLPKGVMLTHRNMVYAQEIFRSLAPPIKLVSYGFVPMFHIYGMSPVFSSFNGTKLVIAKRFDLKRLFEAVEKYKISSFNGVPTTLLNLLNTPLAQNYDLSSLRAVVSGGSPLSPELVENTMKKMRVAVMHGWGMTETCGLNAGGPLINVPLNATGVLIAMAKLKVVNPETREELGVNEDGELLFSSPGVMKGYYKNPEADKTAFEDGFLCTGDIGHYDENGVVYITDRLKELIKYKGFQVPPAELEILLLSHPKIGDVGVAGVPDPVAGQVPRAFVVKEDQSLTAEEVQKYVEGKVSSYKYIRGGVVFLDEIPRNFVGKILRRELAKLPFDETKA